MLPTSYQACQRILAQGWNTWNTRNVLSHVLLPAGLAINLALKEYRSGFILLEPLIGRRQDGDERIRPGLRSYDGSYTELELTWRDIVLRIETGLDDHDNFVALITPLRNQMRPASLILHAGFLWNRPGHITLSDNHLVAEWPQGHTPIFSTATPTHDPQVPLLVPYLALPLTAPLGVSSSRPVSLEEIQNILRRQRQRCLAAHAAYGALADAHAAMQSCLAWNTIFDPANLRVISPVSRRWNSYNGGWVLFCWDTYFAAYMAALDNPPLACANAVEITREKTPAGFVPNTSNAHGFKTLDRSQPPVGSMIVRELFRLHRQTWLLQLLFDDLLTWNRWWMRARLVNGLLTWGSNPYPPRLDNEWETKGVGSTFGAALESGLDNSPMYDDIPVDPLSHCLHLHDVGLNSLYLLDCECLADLAHILGRSPEAHELRARAETFRHRIQSLWCPEHALFLNRRTDSGQFVLRISPTNFYPLLAGAATPEQADLMLTRHFYNLNEFWGQWVLPSIARNDPAFPEQHYWRGRIWPPMNFLVYLGLRRYHLRHACADLAQKSLALLLNEWQQHGHVHENYSAITGQGCDYDYSDAFYHWGGLLALIALIEAGHLPGPEQPLDTTP
ncbi:MAG: trehalase family glycosidase [bacterium]|nr:trehalase family glycosidase [bacterium]